MCKNWTYPGCMLTALCLFLMSITTAADASLVGWWKFDEPSGYIAADSSGYGNHGVLHGGLQLGGGGLQFDGIDDYVDCGDGPSLNITGEVTVAAWIRIPEPVTDRKIAGNQDGITGGYKLGVYSDLLEFEIRTADNAAFLNRNAGGGMILEPGLYHHVVGVYSQGNYIRTYVNGVLDRELSTTAALGTSTGTFKIGREPFSDSYFWLGFMEDVRVYNRALTQQEIVNIVEGNDEPLPSDLYPANGAILSPDTEVTLTWPLGIGAVLHDVYFGVDYDMVANADPMMPDVYLGSTEASGYELSALEPGLTYYWRIDQVEADGTIHTGAVWRFTTVTTQYMQMDLVALDASITSIEFPLPGAPESGPISASLATGLETYQAGLADLPSRSGLLYWPVEISFPLLEELGRRSIATTLVGPFRLDPEDDSRLHAFDMGYIDDPDLGKIVCCNNNTNNKRTGIFQVPASGGTISGVFEDATIREFTATEARWLRSAMDEALAEVRALNRGMPHIAPGVLDEILGIYEADPSIEIVLYFPQSGEFRTANLSGADSFELSAPVAAWRPLPANGSTGLDVKTTLSWLPESDATLHHVYLGIDEAAVMEATTDSPEYRGAQDGTSYAPGILERGVTYYWRVDEVQADGTVLRGTVWHFATALLTIGDLKRPGREQYLGRTVTIEGIFVPHPLPMLVTDLDVVLANMPMQEDQYILLVGTQAEEIDPQVFGGVKLSLTGVVLAPDAQLGPIVPGPKIDVTLVELLEIVEPYYWIKPVIPDWIPVLPQPDRYAILFSGGVNDWNNHGRYWNDLKFMYKTLVNTYGYPPENIAVLYADGNAEDNEMPVHYSGTQADLETVFELLKGVTDVFDTVFLFTTNHGGGFWENDPYGYYMYGGQHDANGDEPGTDVIKEADYGLDLNGDGTISGDVSWDEELCGWGDEVFDDTFPDLFAGLTYGRMIIVMEQCFSGGLIWDMAGSNRVIMSAAGEYEPSWAMPPSYTYDEFSYHFTCAVNGATPDGDPVNADANGDGQVSMLEAFNYAQAHDTQPETPHYEDNGDGVPHTGSMPSGGDGTAGSNTFL